MMTTYPRATLLRRMGALLYDLLFIAALLMIVAAIWLLFNRGEAITSSHHLYKAQQVTFILTPFLYYLFFWLRDAHSTGMRAWRLRVQQFDGKPITANQAIRRLLFAIVSWIPLGLGFLWAMVSPTKLTWHDRLSGTEIIQLPKKAKSKK